MKFILTVFKGFFLGIAMVLPGVSGGTIAFILGIYEKLIQEISNFKSSHIKNALSCLSFNKAKVQSNFLILKQAWDWPFLMSLLAGMLLALLLFIAFVVEWIQQYSLIFYSVIFGFVLASMITPVKQIKKSIQTILFFLISFTINFALFYWGKEFFTLSNDLPSLFFIPVGFLVAATLIVPGISGSYILLIFGLYEKTLVALKQLDFIILSFFILGLALGFILTAKLIQKLLKNYWNQSLAIILGLMTGSLYSIYPLSKKAFIWNSESIIFLISMLLSFLIFLILEFLVKKLSKKTS